MKWLLVPLFALLLIPLVSDSFAQTATSATGTSETESTEIEPFVFENQPYTKPHNLTDEGVGFYEVQNPDGTFTLTTHYDYFQTETGEFLPYRLNQDDSMIQVEVNGGKFVFDKTNGAVTIFDEDEIIVSSDSYIVKSALDDSDVWNNLTTNNEPVTVQVLEKGETLEILFEKENDLGLFRIVNTIYAGELKTDLYFINYSLDNSKISFTETLELPNNIITLNEQVIDLNQFVGQSFDRSTLEQNEDLILEAKEIMYNAGLGFEYLWQVNIHEDNKISLDYANSETVYNVGDVAWLDPTWNVTGTINGSNVDFNISTLNNASVNSGDISGTALTSSQITSLQSALNSGTTTWSQPFTASPTWAVTSPYSVSNANSNVVTVTTGIGGDIKTVNTTNNGSVKFYNQQNSPQSGGNSALIKDFTTNQYYGADYPFNTIHHRNFNGAQANMGHYIQAGDVFEIQVSGNNVYNKKNGVTYYSGTTTSSVFTGLHAQWSGSSFYFTMEATGGFASSLPILTLNYSTATVPTAPQNLLVGFNSPNVDLQFTTPSSDGGSAITGYKIEHSTDGTTYTTLVNDTGNTNTTYSHTSPTTGQTNYYKVYAINSIGLSVASNVDSILAGTPPDAVSITSASILDPLDQPHDVTITWGEPNTWGTGTPQSYELYESVGGAGNMQLVNTITYTAGNISHVHTISNILPNTDYHYMIRAVTNHGTSADSNIPFVTTPDVPSTPNTPTATILDPDVAPLEIELSFQEPNNGGNNIKGYQIDMWDSINSSWQTLIANTANTNLTATIQNLIKDTSYQFKVAAINTMGTSPLSIESVSITTPDVPTAPTVTVIAQNDTEILISWSPNYDGGSNVTSWDISLDGTVVNLPSGTTSYLHSGLAATSNHVYEVRGNNLLGNGAWSASQSSTTYPFNPDWIATSAGNIAYNIDRDDTTLPEELTLTVLRDISPTWNLSCEYRTTDQVLSQSAGTVVPMTGVSIYIDTQGYSDAETIYITCSDGGVELFSATSHGNITNALSTGLVLFDSMGGFMGAPAAMLMVLAIFSLATPRNAPTVLIIGLAVTGILGSVGLLYFEEAIWGLLLVCGALGIFGIKRFF